MRVLPGYRRLAAGFCLATAIALPIRADEPPADSGNDAADSRVIVRTHRAPPPPRTDEPMQLRVYPGLQAPVAPPPGPPPGATPAPSPVPATAPAAARPGPAPGPTPAPGTPGGIPLGIDVGMSLATCPDGSREISALDLGGWAVALQPACVDRALQGRLTVHRPSPRGATGPATSCDPGRWTCTTTR